MITCAQHRAKECVLYYLKKVSNKYTTSELEVYLWDKYGAPNLLQTTIKELLDKNIIPLDENHKVQLTNE